MHFTVALLGLKFKYWHIIKIKHRADFVEAVLYSVSSCLF